MLFNATTVTAGFLGSPGAGAAPTSSLTASSHYGLGAYAVFHRFGPKHGAYLTAQNPYLNVVVDAQAVSSLPGHGQPAPSPDGSRTQGPMGATSLSYAPLMMSSTAASFAFDAGILGIHQLTGEILPKPAQPLDVRPAQSRRGCSGSLVLHLTRRYLIICRSVSSARWWHA
jgi:hypothetical protein